MGSRLELWAGEKRGEGGQGDSLLPEWTLEKEIGSL